MSFLVQSKVPINDLSLFSRLLVKRGYQLAVCHGSRNGKKTTHEITGTEKNARASAWIVVENGRKYLYHDKDKGYSAFARKQVLNGKTVMQEYTIEKIRQKTKLKITNETRVGDMIRLRIG